MELCVLVHGFGRAFFILEAIMKGIDEKEIDEFEGKFSDFIDGEEYDKAEDALFAVIRAAYAAGWRDAKAAGSDCGKNNE